MDPQAETVAARRKVLVLTSSFPRHPSDWWARFILNLYLHLPPERFDVVVLAPHAPGAKRFERIESVRVHRFRYFLPERLEALTSGAGVLHSYRASRLGRVQVGLFVAAQLLAAIRLAARERPDLIHAHWLVPQGLVATVVKLLFRVPVIVTGHGTDLFGLRRLRPIKQIAVRFADACTVNSSATAGELAALWPPAAPRTRIVPMGVDAELFHPAQAPPTGDAPLLLCVGRLIGWKGIEYALRALPLVRARFPGARLLVAGVGPDEGRLRGIVGELQLDDAAELLGGIGQAELADLYRRCSAVIVPSIRDDRTGETEAQNVAILEALASGVPVVATRVGGIPDVIDGVAIGRLVDQRNPEQIAAAVIEILSDPRLSARLRTNGRRLVEERFAWPRIAERFAEVYEEVCR